MQVVSVQIYHDHEMLNDSPHPHCSAKKSLVKLQVVRQLGALTYVWVFEDEACAELVFQPIHLTADYAE